MEAFRLLSTQSMLTRFTQVFQKFQIFFPLGYTLDSGTPALSCKIVAIYASLLEYRITKYLLLIF